MDKYSDEEPILYPDIPLLPCIYEDWCEDWDEFCPCDNGGGICQDYKWREDVI